VRRQLVLWDREFVRFAGLDDDIATVAISDRTGNGAPEMTVPQPIGDNPCQPLKNFLELRTTGVFSVELE
jgi:hypothetical protein